MFKKVSIFGLMLAAVLSFQAYASDDETKKGEVADGKKAEDAVVADLDELAGKGKAADRDSSEDESRAAVSSASPADAEAEKPTPEKDSKKD
ncbi:MAG: hypothetical protein LBI20_02690 [Holosporales bacterium]|nr:hypothetical protein [Holosporales bacterium]